ncbi:MAG: ABC transporter permease [Bacteroidales bacterium]|nr:ABC transporter permease [Bacteroidales bacterium]
MIDLDRWQEIFIALKQNKLRSFFTAFGVFWGIFLLVIMLGSGNGLENGTRIGMGDMATNSFFIWTQRTTIPYKGYPRGRFFNYNNKDTEALKENIPEIEYIAPRIGGFGRTGDNVVRGERVASFNIQGDYPAYNLIDPMNILQGRFINQKDIEEKRKVAVIGSRVVTELFTPQENPIGEYLMINGVYCKVVGVVSSKKNSQQAQQENQVIYLPFTTVQKVYNLGDIVGFYSITSKPGVPASVLEQKIREFLKERHAIHPDDKRAIGSFNVENQFKKMSQLFAGINGLIWIVGTGTLLAGVIGVSNIMLIVVRERTKEIGVRRALGASPTNIITQVIYESVFLTTLAGYLGLVVGVAILEGVNFILAQFPSENTMFANPTVDFNKALVALAVLVISGIIAGIIPAKRAVKIRPIEALHDE